MYTQKYLDYVACFRLVDNPYLYDVFSTDILNQFACEWLKYIGFTIDNGSIGPYLLSGYSSSSLRNKVPTVFHKKNKYLLYITIDSINIFFYIPRFNYYNHTKKHIAYEFCNITYKSQPKFISLILQHDKLMWICARHIRKNINNYNLINMCSDIRNLINQ